ncbi:MAG TPA: C40 family peptidase [bacterium]|nr:C40 family peptidase [bacterium]
MVTSARAASAAVAGPAAITAGAPAASAAWGPPALPLLSRVRLSLLPSRGAAFAANVARGALRYLGRPYQWSGLGQRGFDCSGLVVRVFTTFGVIVPHSSVAQFRAGTAVPLALLGPGDLVFFHTYTSGPSHVGIYLGAGRFIHASASRGVMVSSLSEPYYRSRYLGARRY